MTSKKSLAFTLIELLVVIFIVAVLASLAIISLNNARSQARDSKKLADIRQIQTALELYFNENNSYPTEDYFVFGSPLISSSTGKILMQDIPFAPNSSGGDCLDSTYNYQLDNVSNDYRLFFCLESDVNSFEAGELVAVPGSILRADDLIPPQYYLSFNGVNQYLKTDSVIVSNPTSLTIASWLKKESGGHTYEVVLHQGVDYTIGASSYWMGVDLSDNLSATIGARTGVGWAAGVTNIKAQYGKWHHVAASWNGSFVRVYVDGQFAKQYNLTHYQNLTTPTRVGASTDGSDYQFSGGVRDVRIYNKALSDEEVESLFNEAEVAEENLLVRWKFLDGEDCQVLDDSGFNHHLSLMPNCPDSSPSWHLLEEESYE